MIAVKYFLDGAHLDGWDENLTTMEDFSMAVAADNLIDAEPGQILTAEITVRDPETGRVSRDDRRSYQIPS